MKNYALLLLGIWLIAGSFLDLFNFHFTYEKFVLAVLALAAGGLLVLYELKTKLESAGTLLLGLWLVLGAVMTLFKFSFPSSQLFMTILALLTGMLLILKK